MGETLDTVERISADIPGHWLYHFVDGKTGTPITGSEVSSVDTVLFYYGAIAAGEYLGGAEKARVYSMLSRVDFELMRTNAGTLPKSLTFSHGLHIDQQSGQVRFIPSRWDTISEGILLPVLAIGTGASPKECWSDGLDRTERWVGASQQTFHNLPLFTFFYPLGYLPIQNATDSCGVNYWQEAADAVDLQQEYSARCASIHDLFGYSASDGPDGYRAFRAQSVGPIVIAPPAILAALPFAEHDVKVILPYLMEKELLSGRYGIVAAYEPATNWKAPDMLAIDIGSMLLMLDAYTDQTVWKAMRQSTVISRVLRECGFNSATLTDPALP